MVDPEKLNLAEQVGRKGSGPTPREVPLFIIIHFDQDQLARTAFAPVPRHSLETGSIFALSPNFSQQKRLNRIV